MCSNCPHGDRTADIANDLTAAHAGPVAHRDAAHVAIARVDTVVVADTHGVAAAAHAARTGHAAIGHGDDGRAVARLEIDARMHAAIAVPVHCAPGCARPLDSFDVLVFCLSSCVFQKVIM